MNKEMIKIPNPKELTHKMSNSKMPQQIANAHPHNTDGREQQELLQYRGLPNCYKMPWMVK